MARQAPSAIAGRIRDLLREAGVDASVSKWGREYFVDCGGPGLIRVANFADEVRIDATQQRLDDIGWREGRKIADLGAEGAEGDERGATHHTVAGAIAAALSVIGVDPGVRDAIVSRTAARARRGRRSAETRRLRDGVAEREIAETACREALQQERVSNIPEAVRELARGRNLKESSVRRATTLAWRLTAIRWSPRSIDALGGRESEKLRTAYGLVLSDRLGEMAQSGPAVAADDLRAVVWDTLRDCPSEWRSGQDGWLHVWAQTLGDGVLPARTLAAIRVAPRGHSDTLVDVMGMFTLRDRAAFAALAFARSSDRDEVSPWNMVTEAQRAIPRVGARWIVEIADELAEPYRTEAEVMADVRGRLVDGVIDGLGMYCTPGLLRWLAE